MNLRFLLVLITSFLVATITSSAQLVTIPDANFRNALFAVVPQIDTNNDGLIQVSEAEAVTQLLVSYRNISNMSGIEAFKNLRVLDCSGNQLSNLNVSDNSLLEILRCGRNNLTSLDVTNNTALTGLYCEYNQLSTIDLQFNINLVTFGAQYNSITHIDLSKNTKLNTLYIYDNQLTQINLKPLNNLSRLSIANNPLTSLDLSCNINLFSVNCNPIASLATICLNSTQYADRLANVDAAQWTKSASTSWANCPGIPTVTPVPATIVSIDLCETGDMTFNAVSEAFITNPTYTWLKATSESGPWVNIPGETNQTLVLTDLQMSDNGAIYKVLISSTDYCGTGHMEEAAGKIVLHPLFYPAVTASASVSGAVCDTIQRITYTATPVTGQGTAPVYQWYTYQNPLYTEIPGATNLEYTPATLPPTGTKLFVGMFTDEMCAVESGVASNVLTVEIVPTPEPIIITQDIALCSPSGFTIQTSNTAPTGTQFQWYKNGTPIPGSNTPDFTITSEGIYYMTEDNGVCNMASGTLTIDIATNLTNPQVNVSSSLTGPFCDTLQHITYTATPVAGTVTNPTYQWYNAGSNLAISGATNAVYTPAAKPMNGDRVYVILHTDDACAANPDVQSDILTAVILPTPAPVMTSTPTALCNPAGHVLQTSNTAASGTSFVWYKNGTPIPGSNTRDFTIASEGTYHMTEDNGVCVTSSGSVTIDRLSTSVDPQVNVSSSLTGPACDTLQRITYAATPVTGTVTNPTYQWYNAVSNTAISGATNAVYTPAAKPMNGDQVYVILHTDGTCVANPDVQSNSLTAVILPTPAPVMITRDTAVCLPDDFLITSAQTHASGTQVQWYKNGSPVSGSTNHTYRIDATELPGGSYHIVASNAACSIQSDAVNIELMHTPIIHPIEDIYAVEDELITLNVIAEHAGHYQWTPAAGLSDPAILNPVIWASASQTYTLQATNNQNRCPVTAEVTIIVPSKISIPNVITVNGDGVNDTWEIENLINYKNASIEIFNRWGNVVWKSTGYSTQWDGSNYRSNEVLPAGTYFYIINLNGAQKTDPYTGYIQIVN